MQNSCGGDGNRVAYGRKKSKFEILQPNSMVDDRVQFWKDRILGVFRRALGKLIVGLWFVELRSLSGTEMRILRLFHT